MYYGKLPLVCFRLQRFTSCEDETHGLTLYLAPIKGHSTKKKVTIQTPPHSPEDPPRQLSSGLTSPPLPPSILGGNNGDTAAADAFPEWPEAVAAGDGQQHSHVSPNPVLSAPSPSTRAPYNPFARTLATSEAAYRLQQQENEELGHELEQDRAEPSHRSPLDVDDFKNILLHGGSASRPWQDGSSTDLSSESRQSLFDSTGDSRWETPGTSIEHSEELEDASYRSPADDLDDGNMNKQPVHKAENNAGGTRVSKGPQSVSFADFEQSIEAAPATSFNSQQSTESHTPTPSAIRRKPLPAVGIVAKKAPPQRPASRRAGVERAHSGANGSRTLDATEMKSPQASAKQPPPPPPARKSRPVSQSMVASSESTAAAPALAPDQTDTRPERSSAPSQPIPGTDSTHARSPSDASVTSGMRSEASSPSFNVPPAPPPRRSGVKNSRESPAGRPSTLQDRRRSSGYNVQADLPKFAAQPPYLAEPTEPPRNGSLSTAGARDTFADMRALQTEVDTLRIRGGGTG